MEDFKIEATVDGYKVFIDVPDDADGSDAYDFCISNDEVSNPTYDSDYEQYFNKTQNGFITTPYGNVEFSGSWGEMDIFTENLSVLQYILGHIKFVAPDDV